MTFIVSLEACQSIFGEVCAVETLKSTNLNLKESRNAPITHSHGASLLTIPQDQLLPPSDEEQQSKRRSFMCPYHSSFGGHSFNLLWMSH